MVYRQLGKSALNISRIGFGCMSLKSDDAESEKLLMHALDLGINFFDTADLYEKGANELLVGKAFKSKRDRVILATKVGNQWRPDGSGWDWNPSKKYILESVEQSLRRLDTDYIDLYQLHGGTMQDPIDETIAAFEQLVQEGKIRYYGISSIRPVVIREWVKRAHITSVMMQYSLLDRRPEETSLPLLQKEGIGVLARGGVAQGLLAGKPAKNYLGYNEADVKRMADAVRGMSKKRSPAQTALQFILANEALTSAVVGIRTQAQLEEAVRTLEVPQLTETERQELAGLIPPLQYAGHR
jgi:aryl-alcohol dehydrogenase-like predicted oxidoreductase